MIYILCCATIKLSWACGFVVFMILIGCFTARLWIVFVNSLDCGFCVLDFVD